MPRTKKKTPPRPEKYTVIRDTREHKGHGWTFEESGSCNGTVIRGLETGDYSLEGYYGNKLFAVERKGSVVEWAGNISHKEKWADFKAELERLEEFKHPFIVCEFPFSLLTTFPDNSGLPPAVRQKIKVTPQFLVKRTAEIMLHFKTKILFVENAQCGRQMAASLFKRMIENVYPEESPGRAVD